MLNNANPITATSLCFLWPTEHTLFFAGCNKRYFATSSFLPSKTSHPSDSLKKKKLTLDPSHNTGEPVGHKNIIIVMHLFPLWKQAFLQQNTRTIKGTPAGRIPSQTASGQRVASTGSLDSSWRCGAPAPKSRGKDLGGSEPTVTSGGDRWDCWDRWAMLLLYLDEKSP